MNRLIRVESEAGTFEVFNNLRLVNDIGSPSEFSFDVGNAGTWDRVRSQLAHGRRFRVWLDDTLRMTGRVLDQNNSGSPEGSSTSKIVFRTKLADASFASADPAVRVEKTSISEFLAAIYRPLGITKKDFVFSAGVERDVMTGVPTRGGAPPANLVSITAEQLRPNVGETIFAAAARVLARFRMLQWDTPDGRIYIGAPDTGQFPLYSFRSHRVGTEGAKYNNIKAWDRAANWTNLPSAVHVFGSGGGRNIAASPIKGVAREPEVSGALGYRPVFLQEQGIKTQGQAEARAREDLARRLVDKDGLELHVDGWVYRRATNRLPIPYGTNTTADVVIAALGGALGRYYVHRVELVSSSKESQTATLHLAPPAAFSLS